MVLWSELARNQALPSRACRHQLARKIFHGSRGWSSYGPRATRCAAEEVHVLEGQGRQAAHVVAPYAFTVPPAGPSGRCETQQRQMTTTSSGALAVSRRYR